MIAVYVAAQAPFDGSVKAVVSEIGGTADLLKFGVIGLSFNGQKGFLGNSSSMYDVFPKGAHSKFEKEEWFDDIVKRIDEEEKYIDNETFWRYSNYSLDWMPTPLENCARNLMAGKNTTKCVTGMKKWWDQPVVTVEGKGYRAEPDQMKEILGKYVVTSNFSQEIYERVLRNEVFIRDY